MDLVDNEDNTNVHPENLAVNNMNKDTYAKLSEAFPKEETFTLPGKGGGLTYITGEGVISRLNEVLGVGNWDFAILGWTQIEKDFIVHGRLSVRLPNFDTVVKEQIGSVTNAGGMSLGDSLKGAATDALKKCASMVGVGLYLSHKEATNRPAPPSAAPAQRRVATTGELREQYVRGLLKLSEYKEVDVSEFNIPDDANSDELKLVLEKMVTTLGKYEVLSKNDEMWKKWEQVKSVAQSSGIPVPSDKDFAPPQPRALVSNAIASLEAAMEK